MKVASLRIFLLLCTTTAGTVLRASAQQERDSLVVSQNLEVADQSITFDGDLMVAENVTILAREVRVTGKLSLGRGARLEVGETLSASAVLVGQYATLRAAEARVTSFEISANSEAEVAETLSVEKDLSLFGGRLEVKGAIYVDRLLVHRKATLLTKKLQAKGANVHESELAVGELFANEVELTKSAAAFGSLYVTETLDMGDGSSLTGRDVVVGEATVIAWSRLSADRLRIASLGERHSQRALLSVIGSAALVEVARDLELESFAFSVLSAVSNARVKIGGNLVIRAENVAAASADRGAEVTVEGDALIQGRLQRLIHDTNSKLIVAGATSVPVDVVER